MVKHGQAWLSMVKHGKATEATKATKPGWETNKIQTKTKKTPKENAPQFFLREYWMIGFATH